MSDLRVVTVTWRGWLGIGAVLIFGLVFVGSTAGCGIVECGKGTVEIDGICTVANVLECGVGFVAKGDKCEPTQGWVETRCGDNADYDPSTDTCVGKAVVSGCDKQCPQAGSTICLSGQIFEAPSLLAKWADPANNTAIPVKKTATSGAYVEVYNPLDFVSAPTTSKPLNGGEIYNDQGCFIIKDITIPFAGFLALAVNDKTAADNKWAFVAAGETPIPGKNSVDLEIPAMTNAMTAKWGNDLEKVGSMIVVYLDKTGKAVPGVAPVLGGKKWDAWENNPSTGKPYDLFFFSDDVATFDPGTKVKVTSKSGAFVIKKAQVLDHTGEKAGCTIQSGLGGSSPGTLFFRIYDVTGC